MLRAATQLLLRIVPRRLGTRTPRPEFMGRLSAQKHGPHFRQGGPTPIAARDAIPYRNGVRMSAQTTRPRRPPVATAHQRDLAGAARMRGCGRTTKRRRKSVCRSYAYGVDRKTMQGGDALRRSSPCLHVGGGASAHPSCMMSFSKINDSTLRVKCMPLPSRRRQLSVPVASVCEADSDCSGEITAVTGAANASSNNSSSSNNH